MHVLSHDEVRAIAELARLELDEAEIALYATQLSAILGYFENLQQLDTTHIAPTASVLPLKNVMRPDIPTPALSPSEVIRNAPSAEDNQFLVRPVLGE
jgi:aspartyl-tRNA(Asn)/glutamyl-tRNA(Gln) amidotransferase subunit C